MDLKSFIRYGFPVYREYHNRSKMSPIHIIDFEMSPIHIIDLGQHIDISMDIEEEKQAKDVEKKQESLPSQTEDMIDMRKYIPVNSMMEHEAMETENKSMYKMETRKDSTSEGREGFPYYFNWKFKRDKSVNGIREQMNMCDKMTEQMKMCEI